MGASCRARGTLALFALAVLAGACPAAGRAAIFTYSGNAARTGVYPDNDALSPALVEGGTFGQLFDTKLPPLNGHDQQVYAQPLLAAPDGDPGHKVLVVVTEQNGVYELDPATGAVLRSRQLAPAGETPFDPTNHHLSAAYDCTDITPSVGITGTPVIDGSADGGNGVIYLAAKLATGGATGWPAEYRMFALRLGDLSDMPGFTTGGTAGKVLQFSADNAPGVAFDAKYELQRPGLLWMNGVVYVAFGGHCDLGDYRGWIVGLDAATGAYTARWTTEAAPGAHAAGIWMAGGGLMSDGNGRIFAVTGNGMGSESTPASPTAGAAPPDGLGESALRLDVAPGGTLAAKDFFTPFDAADLDAHDLDFGSGGISALPDSLGTAAHPHELAAVGKNGIVYLLDRDRLGGFAQGAGSGDDVVAKLGPIAAVWGKPTAWPGAGGWLYVPTASGPGGWGGSLVYFRIGGGQVVEAGQTDEAFAYGSGSPIVTSESDAPDATAIVWAVDKPGSGAAVLRAYAPTIAAGESAPRLLGSFPVGAFTKFAPAGAGDNRVYVAGATGDVYGFGHPVNPVLTASPPTQDFGSVPIGSSSPSAQVTFTVAQSAVYEGVTPTTSTSGDFALDTPTYGHAGTSGLALAAGQGLVEGDTVTVPVTFSPTGNPGQRGGAIRVDTDHGPAAATLTGYAQPVAPFIDHAPASVAFGAVPIGGHSTRTATFTNLGATALHVTGVAGAPGAGSPFTVDGLPSAGATIAPNGGTADLTIHYDPTSASPAGGDSLDLVVSSDAANDGPGPPGRPAPDELVVTASADTPPVLTISPTTLDFGPLAVGGSATQSFTVANTGGTPAEITRSKPPASAAFAVLDQLPEATTLQGHTSLTLRVRFAPPSPGSFADAWSINGTGSPGVRDVHLAGSGVAGGAPRIEAPPAPAPAPVARIPRIGSLRIRPSRFGSAGGRLLVGPGGHGSVSFALDTGADVRVTVRRARAAGGYAPVAHRSATVHARVGTTTFRLTAGALASGRYELVLTVLDARGALTTSTATARFTLVASPRRR